MRWSRRGAGDDPKATVPLCRINDPFPVDAHGDEHERLLPPRHEPFVGVAQDLVLFPFARPDDHLGPPAGQPSTPTGTTAGKAFRGPHLEGADHRPRSAGAANRPHLGQRRAVARHNQTDGRRLEPVDRRRPRPSGLKWYQRPWVPRADRGPSSACLVGVASAILPASKRRSPLREVRVSISGMAPCKVRARTTRSRHRGRR